MSQLISQGIDSSVMRATRLALVLRSITTALPFICKVCCSEFGFERGSQPPPLADEKVKHEVEQVEHTDLEASGRRSTGSPVLTGSMSSSAGLSHLSAAVGEHEEIEKTEPEPTKSELRILTVEDQDTTVEDITASIEMHALLDLITASYKLNNEFEYDGYQVHLHGPRSSQAYLLIARELASNREVAIKWRYSPVQATLSSYLEMLNEFLIHQLVQNHDAIPSVHNIFYNPALNDMSMAMDFVKGKSLYQHLEEGTVFTGPQIRSIALQLLDVLAHLQSQRVVHGDIRPSNIILTPLNEKDESTSDSTSSGIKGRKPTRELRSKSRKAEESESYMVRLLDFGLAVRFADSTSLQVFTIPVSKGVLPEITWSFNKAHRRAHGRPIHFNQDIRQVAYILMKMSLKHAPLAIEVAQGFGIYCQSRNLPDPTMGLVDCCMNKNHHSARKLHSQFSDIYSSL